MRQSMMKLFGDREDPRIRIRETYWPDAADPQAAAIHWAVAAIRARGLDPKDPRDGIAAVAALRAAKPELTLKTAAFLARSAGNSA
ncbi:hypothetical protein [Arthrobacter yangruifuii]|uniref:hypothetical protein n=1 Tax=Arthrobacter yangruifuii TaxID=2606616 RepID=UPI0011B6A670|nr:hypothetical protein [Arthrobacter yangruifuii]